MRFSFLAVIVALATYDSDCCNTEDKCVGIVSRGSVLYIKFSLDHLPFEPRNISRLVLTCAIIMVINPKEKTVKIARRNTLVGRVFASLSARLLME
ncbi:uncharacterized protein BJ212DRAFT_1396908 [Suillus subaureus]|uniref:Hydrophobin n=1 Tax=Suillus subaureus TaxID=48587 RepID=A0A9P7J543_9AGAM|nr:uncharacterized protein BJ212DRAFT_1396908 [Suillus subaureus]KAG1803076.1 hypothetical protein BJ212DRAFT_1396908 [Suillus subaureus]